MRPQFSDLPNLAWEGKLRLSEHMCLPRVTHQQLMEPDGWTLVSRRPEPSLADQVSLNTKLRSVVAVN